MTVRDGSPTIARFVTIRNGTRQGFSLVNRSSLVAGDASGPVQQLPPSTKVLADELMQEVLDYFADQGLFAGAGPQIPPGIGSAIVVSSDGSKFVLHAHGGTPERRQAYVEATALFLNLYNRVSGYQAQDVLDSNSDGSLDRIRKLEDLRRPTAGGDGR